MNLVFLLIVTTALPIAWLIADFKGSPIVRRILGVAAILWSFGVAALAGSLQMFNANVYFTTASKDLLSASIEQIKAGKTDSVLRAWVKADDKFHPTYENHAQYKQIVDEAVSEMKKP
jgi:hypothetical protein